MVSKSNSMTTFRAATELPSGGRFDSKGPFPRPLVIVVVFCFCSALVGVRGAHAQSANWFVDALAEANAALAKLLPEVQRAGYQSGLLEVVPSLQRIQGDAATLIARTRRGESYESVEASYQDLDIRWRDAAFRLRSVGNLPASITTHVNQADGVFRGIDRKLGIQPPIDRVRLRDLMIVTLTYMDAMFDDIRLSQGFSQQSEELLLRGRVLRERLRQESYRIEGSNFDEIVGGFTDFVIEWRTYVRALHQLNDPHIQRRLESIRRQGEEVFATLRIPAALDNDELVLVTRRLPADLSTLADQLTALGAARLSAEQLRFAETCRVLAGRASGLAAEVVQNGPSPAARDQFRAIDQQWQDGLRLMSSVDPRSGLQASLARVNASFPIIRDLLGTGSSRNQAEALALAAALEASSGNFSLSLSRYQQFLQPAAYRDRIGTATNNFHDATKALHRQVGQVADSRFASESAKLLVQRWNELTPLVNELSRYGLTASQTESILAPYRELYPLVTQASILLTR